MLGALLWVSLLSVGAARAAAEVLAARILRRGGLGLDGAGSGRRSGRRRRNVRTLRAGGDAGGDGEDGKEQLWFHESIQTHPSGLVAEEPFDQVP